MTSPVGEERYPILVELVSDVHGVLEVSMFEIKVFADHTLEIGALTRTGRQFQRVAGGPKLGCRKSTSMRGGDQELLSGHQK